MANATRSTFPVKTQPSLLQRSHGVEVQTDSMLATELFVRHYCNEVWDIKELKNEILENVGVMYDLHFRTKRDDPERLMVATVGSVECKQRSSMLLFSMRDLSIMVKGVQICHTIHCIDKPMSHNTLYCSDCLIYRQWKQNNCWHGSVTNCSTI